MIRRRYVFGRGDDCDVAISSDPYLSAQHAVVFEDDTGVWAADLGSVNGTWIERAGRRIRVHGPTPIGPGDALIIGRTRIPWTP